MRRVLIVSLFLAGSIFAQQPPKTMTKMVVQLQSSDVPEGSFAAKPKTILRAGTKYCRIEEQPDPENGIHGLIITNEPDSWMVNLASGTGQHMTDPGPTFNCRMPIFAGWLSEMPADVANQARMLEFGHEMEFFIANGAKPEKGPELQSQQTTSYILSLSEYSLALFTYGSPERPLAVALKKGEKHNIFWYSGYGEVDFDAQLFAKPSGVKIEEAKQ